MWYDESMKKTVMVLLLAAILLSGGCAAAEKGTPFTLTFLDVGKADAAVLISADSCVVIDTATAADADKIESFLNDSKISRIDYLFLSHYDKDHIGAAAALLADYEIGCVIMPAYQENSDEYKALLAALAEYNIPARQPAADCSISCDGITYEVFVSPYDDYQDAADNNRSLVIRINSGQAKVLMTGDIEKERIELIKDAAWLSADVLKVPYHGRSAAGLADLVKAVNPDYAVIDCAARSKVDSEVLSILQEAKIEYYLTADGLVTCRYDGSRLQLTQ